jgi:hypothetical protein
MNSSGASPTGASRLLTIGETGDGPRTAPYIVPASAVSAKRSSASSGAPYATTMTVFGRSHFTVASRSMPDQSRGISRRGARASMPPSASSICVRASPGSKSPATTSSRSSGRYRASISSVIASTGMPLSDPITLMSRSP